MDARRYENEWVWFEKKGKNKKLETIIHTLWGCAGNSVGMEV